MHGSTTRAALLGGAMLGMAAVTSARADLIVSNLDVGSSTANVTNGGYRAQEFRTGGQSYLLGDIQAKVGNYSGTYNPVAYLESGNDFSPNDVVLTTLTPGTISSSGQEVTTFTPDTPVTLAASVDYWFVLGTGPGNGVFYWNNTEGNQASTGPGSIGYAATSTDQGSSWSPTLYDFVLEIDSLAVPEPSSLLNTATAAVLAGLGYGWRRRRVRPSAPIG